MARELLFWFCSINILKKKDERTTSVKNLQFF